jgi:Tfp pilus assembly protein PilO
MNNRTITFSVLAVVMVVALWWVFVFSGIRSDADEATKDVETAKAQSTSLEAQLKQLEALEADAPQTQARLDEMRLLLPKEADLAGFIDEANALGAEAGVKWVSVSPAPPTQSGAVSTISFTMTVSGGYYQVLDYLHRVEGMSRLVVVDGVTIDQGEADEAGGPPELTANLTARMFSQSAVQTAPGAPTTPAANGDGEAATATAGSSEN